MIFYPNPASHIITINLSQIESVDIAIFNELGQNVFRKDAISGDFVELDVSILPKGLYLIRLLQNEQIIYSEKCIIE